MPRIRSAKTVAKRIDLQYFAKLSPFRRLVVILSAALPIIAGGWILGANVLHKQSVYSSGPISAAHAVFGQQCSLCHVRNTVFSAPVKDETCLGCHSAPVHNERQTFTPPCSACHVEHKGALRLSATADQGCTQCHAGLKVLSGTSDYDPHITGFDRGHPEFAVLRQKTSRPGNDSTESLGPLAADLARASGRGADELLRLSSGAEWRWQSVVAVFGDDRRKRQPATDHGGPGASAATQAA